jgi:hypothetical protein
MLRLLGILALAVVVLTPAVMPAHAGSYGPPLWCSVTTTGLPGGTVNHRLAIRGSWTDPLTGITGYNLSGVNLTTNADSYGYGHTSPGGGFPVTMSWTDGPTFASTFQRHFRLDIGQDLNAQTRVHDTATNGTFNANGLSTIQCDF